MFCSGRLRIDGEKVESELSLIHIEESNTLKLCDR